MSIYNKLKQGIQSVNTPLNQQTPTMEGEFNSPGIPVTQAPTIPVPIQSGRPTRASLFQANQIIVAANSYEIVSAEVKPDYWYLTCITESATAYANPQPNPGSNANFPFSTGFYLKLPGIDRSITIINTTSSPITINYWAIINYEIGYFG